MINHDRRLLTTRLIPATLFSLLSTNTMPQTNPKTNSASIRNPTAHDFNFVVWLFTLIAQTRDFDEVNRHLIEHPSRPIQTDLAEWGCAYRFQQGDASDFIIHSPITEPGPRRIVTVQAILRSNTVTLSDLELKFGAWYRDPPDGEKVSLAQAYFNAKLIHPQASYLLLATTGAGYEETLSQSEIVETIVATWSDDRYQSTGRPW